MLHGIEKKDSYIQQNLRKRLIEELKNKGIYQEKVLKAMMNIPRHFFLDSAFEQQAYEDRAFQIGAGQTISQPYTVAYQTQLLDVEPFDKILEVGTGSAYQACVLAELGAMVYSIERQKELYKHNNNFFFLKNYPKIKRFFGDGFEGLPSYAPFDKVIITAAAPFIPPKLVEQMKIGAVMVAPVDTEDTKTQRMMRITKTESGTEVEEFENFNFVPMLSGKEHN